MLDSSNNQVEEKQGKKSKDLNHLSNVEFIQKNFNYFDKSNMSNKINGIKHKYINALKTLDIDDLEKKSLAELKDLLDVNKIDITSKRKLDWKDHEKNVVKGLNMLFKSRFFILKTKSSETELADNKNFFAILAGGATMSDVQVKHGKKSFFIECKLNFEAAEYFKYGLKINKDTIRYDHHKYIEGLDDVKDKDLILKINDLFNKDINLDNFLNKIVNDSNIKTGWNKFLKNAIDVEDFILKSPEFKDFSNKTKFKQVWPDDFKSFVKVFDTYSNYYIRKYDLLIDLLFLYFDSDDLDVEDYLIQYHNNKDLKHVLNSLQLLESEIENLGLDIFNKAAFNKTKNLILIIETKFNALLNVLGYENNIAKIKELKDKEKTKYFFKMFISSVGRKSKDSEYNSLSTEDKLGNMQICSAIPIKTNELAKLITAFYVKKDNCAYIQISDMIYQFDKTFNPLNIDNLPIFSECMTNFNIIINISDDLKRIGLHIKAIHPDDAKLRSKNILSFKKNDKNYIMNELDNIVIMM